MYTESVVGTGSRYGFFSTPDLDPTKRPVSGTTTQIKNNQSGKEKERKNICYPLLAVFFSNFGKLFGGGRGAGRTSPPRSFSPLGYFPRRVSPRVFSATLG